jgi:hypothetical protein
VISNRDRETAFRSCLSKMQISLDEVKRIRGEIFDTPSLEAAQNLLEESVSHFTLGRDSAAGEFGFIPRETMQT